MRYLSKILKEFAENKFVLLSGPRQVGKTTISQEWLKSEGGEYYNWDIDQDREKLLIKGFPSAVSDKTAFLLDEIHKNTRWKSWLKGIYDKENKRIKVVVTGSAKLDIYQKGGDSLLGRYEYLRLHPFSQGELMHGMLIEPPENWLLVGEKLVKETKKNSSQFWMSLARFGGFPEPYTRQNDLYYRRWSTRRRNQLIREDLRDLSQVKTISLIEQLALILPTKVGSPLSINNLREDLEVAHDTITNWIELLDRLYFSFRIQTYTKKISRSIKKNQKLYLWDWATLKDEGAKFENMVASHLLKNVHVWNDIGYGEFGLYYIKDKEKREIDFVVTESNKPIVLIEAKVSDTKLSKSLQYYGETFKDVPLVQIVLQEGIDIKGKQSRVISADKFFSDLN